MKNSEKSNSQPGCSPIYSMICDAVFSNRNSIDVVLVQFQKLMKKIPSNFGFALNGKHCLVKEVLYYFTH